MLRTVVKKRCSVNGHQETVRWGPEEDHFMIMLQAFIAQITYSFFCLREIRDFLLSLSGCICLWTGLYQRSN